MRYFVLGFILLVSGNGVLAQAQNDAKPDVVKAGELKVEDPRLIYLEVAALQALDRLDLTIDQLQSLKRLSKNSAAFITANPKQKTTPAFVKTVTELRDAMIADDENRIDDLKEKLEDILDEDDIEIEDRVSITDAARRLASPIIRMMKASQVHAYMDVLDPDELDPYTIVADALDDGRDADGAKWKNIRDRAADDVSWLAVGGNEKGRELSKNLAIWLDLKHKQLAGSEAAVEAANADVEKQMKDLTATLDPFEILRHAMEHEMAELVSNPRLHVAIGHKITQAKKLAAAVD